MPWYRPTSPSSSSPNCTAPIAAKYCAFSGTRMRVRGSTPAGSGKFRSAQTIGIASSQASRIPRMNVLGPPSSSTTGRSVLPRVSTERFCAMIASKSDAIISSGGVPAFCSELMSVSAKTPHLPATGWIRIPRQPMFDSSAAGMRSLALILSMTAPVPPAHLSFMLGIFFLRPVSGSALKMMILASWPPSSTTLPASG